MVDMHSFQDFFFHCFMSFEDGTKVIYNFKVCSGMIPHFQELVKNHGSFVVDATSVDDTEDPWGGDEDVQV